MHCTTQHTSLLVGGNVAWAHATGTAHARAALALMDMPYTMTTAYTFASLAHLASVRLNLARMTNRLRKTDMKQTTTRPLYSIAIEITREWKHMSPYAAPYVRAMYAMNNINESYYNDSARSVVLYFLSNAATWRGEAARRIKAELKSILNEK